MKIYPTIRGIVILGSIFASASLLKNMPDRNVDHHSSMSQDGFNAQYTEQSNTALANRYESEMLRAQDQYIDNLIKRDVRPPEIDERAWALFQSIKQYAKTRENTKRPVDLRYPAARLIMAHTYYPDDPYEGFEMAVLISSKESDFYAKLINANSDAFGPEQFIDKTAKAMMAKIRYKLPDFIKTRVRIKGLDVVVETKKKPHHLGLKKDIRLDPLASAALFYEWDKLVLTPSTNRAYGKYGTVGKEQKKAAAHIFTAQNKNIIKYHVHLMGRGRFNLFISRLIDDPTANAAPAMYLPDKKGQDNELMRVAATNAPFFTKPKIVIDKDGKKVDDYSEIKNMHELFKAQRKDKKKPVDVRNQFKGWLSFEGIFNKIRRTSNLKMRNLKDAPVVAYDIAMVGTPEGSANTSDYHTALMRITKTAAHYRGLAQAEPKGRSRVYVVGKSERNKDLFAAVRPESVTVSPRLKPIG